MGTRILIPLRLRKHTKKKDSVWVQGRTVGELLQRLSTQYPNIRSFIFNGEGRLRSQVFLNNEDIRDIQNEETPVTHHDRVAIGA